MASTRTAQGYRSDGGDYASGLRYDWWSSSDNHIRYVNFSVGANEYPQGTIRINGGAWLYKSGGGDTKTFEVYIQNRNDSEDIYVGSLTLKDGVPLSSYEIKKTGVSGKSALAGADLYVSIYWRDNTASPYNYAQHVKHLNDMNIFVDLYDPGSSPTPSYTSVVAGNKIMATDRSQTGTATTAGTKIQDSHFSAGTKATASAFNTQVLGK